VCVWCVVYVYAHGVCALLRAGVRALCVCAWLRACVCVCVCRNFFLVLFSFCS
jgi:hypothetical protein